MRRILLSAIVLSLFAVLSGCEATPEASEARVKEMASKVKEGMSEAEVVALFGEPEMKEQGSGPGGPGGTGKGEKLGGQDPKDSVLWRYKNKDKFYELWVRFYKNKASWAMAYDKSSKLSEG